MISLSNGYLLVAYNHSPSDRAPLSLALSRDSGRSWRIIGEIETDAALQYAYPTMEQAQNGCFVADLVLWVVIIWGWQWGPELVVIYTVMKADDAFRLLTVGMKIAILDLKHLA
eukprot:scaffold671701_cov60-Prasinocladus_malaysianus.AAC.1